MASAESWIERRLLEWVAPKKANPLFQSEYLVNFLKRVNLQQFALGLDEAEVYRMFELAADMVTDVTSFRTEKKITATLGGYGLECNGYFWRNFFMAVMTGAAVKQATSCYAINPTVVELGMGPGLNCIASLLINPDSRVVAFETDQHCIELGTRLMKKYGLETRVDILDEDFLRADLSGLRPDVVVNENLNDNLACEPQFQAANAILPFAKPTTLYVPGGLDIYLEGQDLEPKLYTEYRKRLMFSEPIPIPLIIERRLKPLQALPERISVEYQCAILDNSGNIVQFPFDRSLMLDINPITGKLEPIYPNSKGIYLHDLNLHESAGQDITPYVGNPKGYHDPKLNTVRLVFDNSTEHVWVHLCCGE